jgi:hypothetical protein
MGLHMQFTKQVLFVSLVALLAGTSSILSASDPGIADTVRADSTIAFVTGIGVVPVTFSNDENLAQIEVTLRQYSDQVRIDSFSFSGGRLDSTAYSREVLINSDSNIVTVYGFTTTTPIAAGRGLLGNLYLSYSQTITPQTVRIDTTTWMVGPIQHSNSLRTYEASQTFKPQFIRGQLDIREAPDSFDSIWVSDVEAAPGTPVVVDVYAYTERNVVQIALALDYSSDKLILDSVSFIGTRCESAPTKTVQSQVSLHKVYVVAEFASGVPLPPGSGPIAALHFTVAADAPNSTIVIDSTTVGIVSNTRLMLTEADGSISFVPIFSPGVVTIKSVTDVDDGSHDKALPTEYNLAQNYPNPFNPSTIIELSLPQAGRVEVEVFNILGRRVRKLLDRDLPAGVHRLTFDGRSDSGTTLATGVYFYRVTASDFKDTKKMLLIK